jgi:starvation-inducible outer membrane lipoprotein
MKKLSNRYLLFAVFVITVLLLNGCVSVPNSPNRGFIRFMSLTPQNPNRKSVFR